MDESSNKESLYNEKNENIINNQTYNSAGGILIDPWSNPYDHNKYNILIVKQRAAKSWGLPKGHAEKGETLEECSYREVNEETGIDFRGLKEGIDYLRVYPEIPGIKNENHIVIKRIHFYVFLLLKRGNQLIKYRRDFIEIKEISWLNVKRLNDLHDKKHDNFRFNRTLNKRSFQILERVCIDSQKVIEEYIQNQENIRNYLQKS